MPRLRGLSSWPTFVVTCDTYFRFCHNRDGRVGEELIAWALLSYLTYNGTVCPWSINKKNYTNTE